jgi:hypothetical protein
VETNQRFKRNMIAGPQEVVTLLFFYKGPKERNVLLKVNVVVKMGCLSLPQAHFLSPTTFTRT